MFFLYFIFFYLIICYQIIGTPLAIIIIMAYTFIGTCVGLLVIQVHKYKMDVESMKNVSMTLKYQINENIDLALLITEEKGKVDY